MSEFVFIYDESLAPGTWRWLDTARTRRVWRCPMCNNTSAFHPDKTFGDDGMIAPSVQCPHEIAGTKCSFHVTGKIEAKP